MGSEESDLKEIRILDRVVSWTNRGITYEADQRHVELCLLEESSNPISTPTGQIGHEVQRRGIVARMDYFDQDRSEFRFAVMEWGKEMSSKTQASFARMK